MTMSIKLLSMYIRRGNRAKVSSNSSPPVGLRLAEGVKHSPPCFRQDHTLETSLSEYALQYKVPMGKITGLL